jgi:type IV pilus assembly protein PilW
MKRATLRARLAGMSIVELMVAMVIGLVGIIVIFQVFSVNEGIRRSTTAGSDEQTSGIVGLTLIERELRHAGFGFNDFDVLGCNMKMFDAMRTPSDIPDFPLTGVSITSNKGTTPDLITVTYGGTSETTAPVELASDMDDEKGRFQLPYFFSFDRSDVLLIAVPNGDGSNKTPCTLRQISTPGSPAEPYLEHLQGSDLRFNKPEGTPVVYPYRSRVYNLGPFPARIQITVVNDSPNPSENNQLIQVNSWAEIADPIPMAEQIVQLKAEYGMDDGKSNGTVVREKYDEGDNIVDEYTSESPKDDDILGWRHVRSVRLALVSRSNAPERSNSGKGCDATPDYSDALDDDTYPVRWARGPDTPKGRPIDVRTTDDWRCYKYKVYETVVPLRNLLWRQAK